MHTQGDTSGFSQLSSKNITHQTFRPRFCVPFKPLFFVLFFFLSKMNNTVISVYHSMHLCDFCVCVQKKKYKKVLLSVLFVVIDCLKTTPAVDDTHMNAPPKNSKALDLSPYLFLSQVSLLALGLFAPASPNKQALCLWTLPLLLCPSPAAWYGCSRGCVSVLPAYMTPCLFTLVDWQRESGFWLSSCANVKQKLNWSEQWRDWITERLEVTIGGRRWAGRGVAGGTLGQVSDRQAAVKHLDGQ